MTMQEFFIQNPTAAVAFSGGVDSAWLLHEARTWARRTAAYFVRTPFQPDFELEDARDIARRLDVPLTVLAFDVLSVPQAAANPPDRCYHCKRALFTRLMEAAGADGLMIEVHNNPKAALCDGAQSLDLPQFAAIMEDIKKRVAFEGKQLQ